MASLYRLDEYADYGADMVELTNYDRENGTWNDILTDDAATAQRLWEAVLQDFEEGNLGRRYLFDTRERLDHCYYNDLTFYLSTIKEDEKGDRYTSSTDFTVTLTTDAKHTLAVLAELGVTEQTGLVTYGQAVYEGNYDGLWDDWEGGAPEVEAIPAPEPTADAVTTVYGVSAVRSLN